MSNTRTITAKVAALVAGFAMVGSAFVGAPSANAQTSAQLQAQIAALLAQIAALQAQLNGTTSTSCVVFTRDLTVGSTGSDVTSLQSFLISKGFSIPAGATGYFGAQTRAAVASFQAANSIAPVAGYFGPLTRARVNAMCTVTPNPTPNPTPGNDTTLHGDEADLNHFKMLAEDSTLNEGDQGVKLGTAEFDVDNGDVNVQRAELTLEITGTGAGDQPRQYFDNISVWADGKKLADVDASDRDAWDDNGDDTYTISLSGFNYIVREGDTADLTFEADVNDSLDADQQASGVTVSVENDGIRAVDAKGIQQYVGNGDSVDLDFDAADNGDLSLRESSDNPDDGIFAVDENDTSDAADVLVGELRNKGDNDSDITAMTFSVATSSGVTASLASVVRQATLEIDGHTYNGDVNNDGTIDFDDLDATVDANDSIDFTLSVKLAATSLAGWDEGNTIQFTLSGSNVDAEGSDTGDSTDVTGTLNGGVFTASATGIEVNGSSTSEDVHVLNTASDSYGDYTITFSVHAGDDDLYIPQNAATSTASTTGVVYTPNAADAFTGSASATLTASGADTDSNDDFYIVHAGDDQTFVLTVHLNPDAAGTFEVDMTDLYFDTDTLSATALTDFDVSGNEDFQTQPKYIPN